MNFFKQCSNCSTIWHSQEEFLHDAAVELVGYQININELSEGLFLFNHACGTTMALTATVFRNLYSGPVFTERLFGSEQCSGLCLRQDDLNPCPEKCECAFVREVIQEINHSARGSEVGHELRPGI
jgi:hypothetical protein